MNWLYLLGIPALPFYFYLVYGGYKYFTKNKHTVVKGKLYRSGQLSVKNFEKYLKKNKIETVINHRGTNNDEYEICKKLGINYHVISESSSKIPSRENLLKIIEVIEGTSGAFYVHCLGGADRTSLTCAIWLLMNGADKKKALRQIQPLYLHWPFHKPAKRFFVEAIWYQDAEWMKQNYQGIEQRG